MAERIPGIINSPFSENGKLHLKSTLAKILDKWDPEPEPDPDIWKEKFFQRCEEQEVEDSRSEFLCRGMDPSDPFIAESIKARGYYAGYTLRQLDNYLPASKPKSGRPRLDPHRSLIAFGTLMWDALRREPASLSARFDRVATLLGPGVHGYHVKRAVLSAVRLDSAVRNYETSDDVVKAFLELQPLAKQAVIDWVFEFLDREYGEEKHREQSPVSV